MRLITLGLVTRLLHTMMTAMAPKVIPTASSMLAMAVAGPGLEVRLEK